MASNSFWKLIEQSRQHGKEQVEWLTETLAKASVDEIARFEIEFINKMEQSYTSAIWGAAYVLLGGCSDDGFDYFRGWLIAQGEDVYNRVLNDPEYLAEYLSEEVLQENDVYPELEEMLSVATDAYTYSRTGSFEYDNDMNIAFLDELEARGYQFKPKNIEFDWEEDDLEERYPVLWARFGEEPLG
ncbi:molybdenum metabolism regulator [Paenibacillus sp. PK3_47]|uniref:DUF4240 domain-containing protein n=1 Tax=Paenibacillus sp. PK3_47 TaxID=2072642 RepID=UPI00201DB059|nr:DUF4240 domain-containing protein [Paenibacillus sp. PK3_47]UQZ32197.1 molybdenum metabolism regulator [Paenibacillus sp. PK3_47]